MPEYNKPEVTISGYSPEPVEAGCCLRSCGGAPGGMQAGHHLKDGAKEVDKMLDNAIEDKTDKTEDDAKSKEVKPTK